MRLAAVAVAVPAFFQTCLPTPPDPDPEPPLAVIETTCLSADCLVVELSGEASEGADAYEWFIDGVDFGTDPVIAIDLPSRGLADIELVVTNDDGSSSDQQYLFTTEVANDTADPLNDREIQAAVVAGARSCNSLAIISTVGGCFDNSGGSNLEHIVTRTTAGGVGLPSAMVYDPTVDDVINRGTTAAVVWESLAGPQKQYPACLRTPTTPSGSCETFGPRPFRRPLGPYQTHLTSYYTLPVGDVLVFDLGHGAYLGDPDKRPLDTLTLDCTSGSLQVSATQVP